ncbi:MAG: ASCH domain-containing protein [Cytophagales bacterium]|nr:ASCH domain-containing protein [Cytophagales bacterium]
MNTSKTWKLGLQDRFFEAIVSGKKTVEGRVLREYFNENGKANIKRGDRLLFKNERTHAVILGTVTDFRHYSSVEKMLESEPIGALLPGISSAEAGVSLYYSFPNYRQLVEKHGIYAVSFELD